MLKRSSAERCGAVASDCYRPLEKLVEIADPGGYHVDAVRRIDGRRWSLIAVIHDHSIAILRCPLDQSKLHAADPALVARLNSAISAGGLRNRAGSLIEKTLDGALVREAGDLAYPIVDQIPVMLADEAIAIDQLPVA